MALSLIVVSSFQNCGKTQTVKGQFKPKAVAATEWGDKVKVLHGTLLTFSYTRSSELLQDFRPDGDNILLDYSGRAFQTLTGEEIVLSGDLQDEVRRTLLSARLCQKNVSVPQEGYTCMGMSLPYGSAEFLEGIKILTLDLGRSICAGQSVGFCSESEDEIKDLVKKLRAALED